jgi:catechol 2,3-dioxygenase-like lactoylglutathione lyase family enzyme
MLKNSKAFSGFSVDDIALAKKFYGETLGLDLKQDEMGLTIHLGKGTHAFVYQKDDHTPASFTILNFPVSDIDRAVNELKNKGVEFESYDFGDGAKTDKNNIMRGKSVNMGPDIAWFKDPAGNVLSVLED